MAGIRVGCAVLVEKNGAVLLGKRGKQPAYGQLVIPGGGVDLYEDMQATAHREIKEEAGIEIKDLQQFGTYQIINKERENHRIIIYWRAKYKSGEVIPSDDLLTAKFYTPSEIKKEVEAGNITDTPLQVLKDAGWVK